VLAAARLRGQPGAVSSLLLAYPNADMTLSQPSVEQEGHGWGLDADDLRWFVEQWIPGPRDRDNPAFSPVHADLDGLTPAVVATAGHDPPGRGRPVPAVRRGRASVSRCPAGPARSGAARFRYRNCPR
jgi:acetyl esterase/lipase